jgi:hypothetical protein
MIAVWHRLGLLVKAAKQQGFVIHDEVLFLRFVHRAFEGLAPKILGMIGFRLIRRSDNVPIVRFHFEPI